ncbi:MAG TPA: orotate phosphoribosyltransferase [Gammaproteobacteria bacterium]|nr:orotate phosphoribosyltransferase [Gammaproteobacteria bacterium]
MSDFRTEFLQLAIQRNVLRFGEFTLKSGRISPYFFNAGLFNRGQDLALLGRFYAQAILAADLSIDLLFGPAYKGIPLASITAATLFSEHGIDLPYAFNRKEAKQHGEGGNIVGAPLAGRIAIIDDVITAGTAIRESAELIEQSGATCAAIVIALDRQERGTGTRSAVQEVQDSLNAQVISIATFSDLIDLLTTEGKSDLVQTMQEYRTQYGIHAS